MILVIGGRNQGKLLYIKENLTEKNAIIFGCSKDNVKEIENINADVVYNLQNLIKENKNYREIILDLIKNKKDVIISCNEVGMGIVPINKNDREYRDAVGKMCIELAKTAEKVIRVSAGCGINIK